MSSFFITRSVASALIIAGSFSYRGLAAETAVAVSGRTPANQEAAIAGLRGVMLVTDRSEITQPVPAGFSGYDASRVPELQNPAVAALIAPRLERPIDSSWLQSLPILLQGILARKGDRFAIVYMPPQEVADGVVRIVVTHPKLEGEVGVDGARYFSPASYRAAAALAPGAPIDASQLDADIAWLNDNPYRHVTAMAEPGSAPGTTRLALLVREERPWQVTAGYSNSGTPITDEDRVSLSAASGNAFGRGDQLGYSFIADPALDHSLTHSANYTTIFHSRQSLTLYGSWTKIVSDLPEPLTQTGHSWQVGGRYNVPLKAPREGWTQNLAFTADFKASDNNLEFATIPVTNNLTHIVQFGSSYALSFRALGGENDASVAGYVSPGGLSSRNHTRYFDESRPGAKAEYAYAHFSFSHHHPLPAGFAWVTAIEGQLASGALLGTEQLNGGGSAGVRGYPESSAFGDWGFVANNELHLPPISVPRFHGHIDLFAFADAASLNLRVDNESTDLRSVGLGVYSQLGRWLSLRAAYGWQLRTIDTSGDAHSHAHVALTLAY